MSDQLNKTFNFLGNVVIGTIPKMFIFFANEKNEKKCTVGDMKGWTKLTESKINPKHEVFFLLTGEISDVIVVDFDDIKQYNELVNLGYFPNPEDYTIIKTRKGVHLYFKYTDKLLQPDKQKLNVDIQGNRKRVYLPPTKYKLPDGTYFRYEYIYINSIKPIPDILLNYINSFAKNKSNSSSSPCNDNVISLNTNNNNIINNNTEMIMELCDIIDVKFINYREDWLKLVFAMKRIGLEKSYVYNWSLKGTDCKILLDEDWDRTWDSEDNRDTGVGLGTIKYYAKLSNPEEYRRLTDNNIDETYNKLINNTNYTEYDIALFFDILEGKNVVYVKDSDALYIWCNNKWFLDDVKSGYILKTLISTNFYYYFENKKQLIINDIYKLESTEEDTRELVNKLTKIKKIMECLRTTSYKSNLTKEIIQINLVKTCDIQFDANPNVLGFNSKKLDISTGVFSDIEYKDYITMSTGYDYVEPEQKDKTDLIDKLFKQVFPNDEIRKSFLSILYNCLIGGQKEKFTIAKGDGGNGKGVLMELVKTMLGEYAYDAPVSLITKEMRGGANPEVANLNRKRLVIMKEPSATDKLWLSNIKQLVGNSTINARGLYSGNTKCILEGTIILETNHSLNFNGKAGDAELRRFIEIMFESTFTDDKTMIDDATLQNVYMKDDSFITNNFRDEYKCVLLKYILDNAKKTIYVPDCVKQQTSQYIDNQNSFKFWLEDKYELTDNQEDIVKVRDMFNLYCESEEYKNTNREHRPNLHKFTLDFVRGSKKLKNKFRAEYRPQTDGVRIKMRSILLGIKLKDDGYDSE